jgi:hypothetical protein
MSAHGPDGVTISVTATITNYRDLGSQIANANSRQQAEFLAGFAEALHFAQPDYIADDVLTGNAVDAITDTLDSISASIKLHRGKR